ncbi:hypothetical protein [Cryobacterium luteum]|uniref:Uncharacterized protein n=1 Tax=Cryobacterium luteum TaxID=1424661 RepID=A0A1H8AUM1_9MICO|nr:hypothetical protein [Cryobacterium luteum]TFB88624.1 hypothetical protein E3O10_12660 [Cryobacterium luteum]SEM73654.1 hypothetical protein SAMN05216281_101315 [Cryobacterium luteum]
MLTKRVETWSTIGAFLAVEWPLAIGRAGILHALVKRQPLSIGQRISHGIFWRTFSAERAMDQVHESRAARRSS